MRGVKLISVLKKAGVIIGKMTAVIFFFYLFLSWVIVPLTVPFLISDQGTKILNKQVKVRNVTFDPFRLRLSVKEMNIFDYDKSLMAGFDEFRADLSFLGLLKKNYRLEEISLNGLKVNAVLFTDGKINILGLVPSGPGGTTDDESKVSGNKEENVPDGDDDLPATQAAALPPVFIDKFVLLNGEVTFADKSVQPSFVSRLSGININASGISTMPDCSVNIDVSAVIDDKGTISSATTIAPFVQPLKLETSFILDRYAMTILSPYTGKYTGRGLKDGNLRLKMDYLISDNNIRAGHELLIRDFEFGSKVESKDAINLPFGLAIALLEDPQGRINISLPVKGDMSDPEFEYWHIVGQVVRNFFVKLVTKPFAILASVIGQDGGTEELGTVHFPPGKAVLSSEETDKIKALAKGLMERPRLSIKINGVYDPESDWKAIKADIFDRDYDDLKHETTRSESWIYQQLYQRKFGVRALWDISNSYKNDKGDYREVELNQAIRAKIIEDGLPDKDALEVLAQARAALVHETLIGAGLDPQKMNLGQAKTVQASMGKVPLEFILTVFDNTDVNYGNSVEPSR